MWILRERQVAFLNIKFVQIFFAITVLTSEIIQTTTYGSIKPDSPDAAAASWFMNNGFSAIKIWDFLVFSLTIIALACYIYNFKRIWNKGPYFSLDFILAVLWFTSAMANLDPAYSRHPIQTCSNSQTPLLVTLCCTWVISVVFCWLNMLLFVVSAFISCRVVQEKRQGIYSKPSLTPEVKKRTSQRQSVLLKQGLENPDKSQPVLLESGVKPLMLVQLAKT